MKRTLVTWVMAAAVMGWTAATRTVEAEVAACQPPTCAEVKVLAEPLQTHPGQTVTVKLNFTQAPDDSLPGGPDETAALALSIGMGSGAGAPRFRLADCAVGADGLPAAVHRNDPAIAKFKVVVENAYCPNGRTHCLCPEAGGPVPDSFINIVIYGPNPLPPRSQEGIEIPTLPPGPLDLLSIDLRAESGASGDVLLHLYNQVQETQAPQLRALLSLGDKVAKDQTCKPKPGEPPCSTGDAASQVVTADTTITIAGQACIGDLDGGGAVLPDELAKALDGFFNDNADQNPAADGNGNGTVDPTEVAQVLNNFFNDECSPYQS